MKPKSIFVCNECGYHSAKWLGRCPSCNSWNTFEEQMAADEKKPAAKQAQTAYCGTTSPAVLLDKLEMPVYMRDKTGYGEVDRVLGWRACQRFCCAYIRRTGNR